MKLKVDEKKKFEAVDEMWGANAKLVSVSPRLRLDPREVFLAGVDWALANAEPVEGGKDSPE